MTMLPTSVKTTIGNNRAFTLLELLLVITLMALLTAIALPRLTQVHSASQLDLGAETMAAYLKSARLEAVQRGLSVQLEFSKEADAYRLSFQDPAVQYEEGFTRSEDGLWGNWHPLPESITVQRVVGTSGASGPVAVVFRPSGTADATEIVIKDRRDGVLSLHLGPFPADVTYGAEASSPPEPAL